MTRSAYYLGGLNLVRQQLQHILGVPLQDSYPTKGGRQDLVFLEAFSGAEQLQESPGGNAFAACRALKSQLGMRVFLLVQEGDRLSPEIARFCLADGCLEVGADGLVLDKEALIQRFAPSAKGVSVDALLDKLEKQIAENSASQISALQKMLEQGSESQFLDLLLDPETGLFDGPFAGFKLDEEFKRAKRFHQPLSLLLLEVPLAADGEAGEDHLAPAEVASVCLNHCRDIDVIARFTKDVFMILMPGTGSDGAAVLAQRMLKELQKRSALSEAISQPCAGLATAPAAGIAHRRDFLARAEACLAMAREGKGQEGFCFSGE